jgi:hypothetical protein
MTSLFVCLHLLKSKSHCSASTGKGSASIAWMEQSQIPEPTLRPHGGLEPERDPLRGSRG